MGRFLLRKARCVAAASEPSPKTILPSLHGGCSRLLCPSVRLPTCPSVRLSTCPSVDLSICPPAHLSVCPPAHLSVCPLVLHLFVYLSVHPYVCPPAHLSVCPPAHLSVCPPVLHLFVYPSVHPYVCPPAHLSVCAPICLLICPCVLSVCASVHLMSVHLFTRPSIRLPTRCLFFSPASRLSICISSVHLYLICPSVSHPTGIAMWTGLTYPPGHCLHRPGNAGGAPLSVASRLHPSCVSRVPTVGHVTPPSPTGRWAHVRLSPPIPFLALWMCGSPEPNDLSDAFHPLPLLRQVGGGEAGTPLSAGSKVGAVPPSSLTGSTWALAMPIFCCSPLVRSHPKRNTPFLYAWRPLAGVSDGFVSCDRWGGRR